MFEYIITRINYIYVYKIRFIFKHYYIIYLLRFDAYVSNKIM